MNVEEPVRDEIKEEVERQLADRDRKRARRRIGFVILTVCLSASIAGAAGSGGEHQLSDLFRRFFTWTGSDINAVGAIGVPNGNFLASVNNGIFLDGTTTGIRRIFSDGADILANDTFVSQVGSATRGFTCATTGCRWGIGPGANSYLEEVSNGSITTPSYIASATPHTLDSVYFNGLPVATFIYGGGTLPARAFTVTGIRFNIRTAGSGGTTNNTFQVSDGTNTCNCTMACNQSTGSKRASCANGAGSGCVFPASAALTYAFSALGDCTSVMDVNGNLAVEGNWQ